MPAVMPHARQVIAALAVAAAAASQARARAAAPFAPGCARAAEGMSPEQIRERARSAIRAANGSARLPDATRNVQRMLSGGIARIPAGVYRIDGTLTLKPRARLFGAGPTKSILYRDAEACRNRGGAMLQLQGARGEASAPGPAQVSGIAFVGVEDATCRGQDVGVRVSGCADYRIDHCYFERFGFAAVYVADVSAGVVDHCSFLDIFKKPINNLGYGVVVYRGNLWEDEIKPGTIQANFVEDCVLVGCRHAIAANGGAQYVFRRNHVRGNVVGQAVDAHGLGYGSKRGTRWVEVYDNLIEEPASGAWAGVVIRGGDGVIFRNVIRGYRTNINLCLEMGAPAGERTAYPRKDQVREMYVWNNEPAGVSVSRGSEEHIKKGRDYFEHARPEYKPFVYPHPLARGGPFDARPVAAEPKKDRKVPGPAVAARPDPPEELVSALRAGIIDGFEGRGAQTVYVDDAGGASTRARLVGADGDAIRVIIRGMEMRMAWDELSPRRLYGIAKKYVDDRQTLEAFRRAAGLD